MLGAVASLAFVAAFAEGRWLFPLGSINRDEPMYTFAARLLRTGHLTLPASYFPYRPWASGIHGGHLVLKYTPVWPGVLAVGGAAGSMRLGVALVAALAVVLTGLLGRELFGRWIEGYLAAAMLLLSPLFLVQEGTYLSYLFQLVLDLAIVLLVLGALRRWPERGPTPRATVLRLVGAGAVWGVAVFAREYDAVLIALPLAAAAVVVGRRSPRRLIGWTGWTALGAAAPLAALIAYNWALLGSPLRNSFSITGPYDTLFFGRRGVFPSSTFTFTAHEAVTSFTRNLTRFPSWTFGGVLLVALALVGLWLNRKRGVTMWAVAGIAVSFSIGYALFWSPYSIVALWPGTRTMGPFYHLALLIPITLFGAAGLAAVFERSRAAGIVVVATMVVITAVGFETKIDRNRPITRQYRAMNRLLGPRLGHAVLFREDRGASGFESQSPFLENEPELRQAVVYATESGSGDIEVIHALPGRTPYRFRDELRPGDALLHPTPFVERLAVHTAAAVDLRVRIVNTVGAPKVATRMRARGIDRSTVLDTDSHKGAAYDFDWTVTPDTAPGASGTIAVEADFAGRRSTDSFELLFPYTVAAGHVSVLTPGWGRYLFQFGKAIWLNQDVSSTLRVSVSQDRAGRPGPTQP